MPIWDVVRKYVINVDSQTIILNRHRAKLTLADLKIGDQLNIYGYTEDGGQTISADVVRDISQPPAVQDYSGIVTKVNADGSFVFVIETSAGEAITVPKVVQVGDYVTVRGILDQLQKILSEVTSINIGKNWPSPILLPTTTQSAPSPAPSPVR